MDVIVHSCSKGLKMSPALVCLYENCVGTCELPNYVGKYISLKDIGALLEAISTPGLHVYSMFKQAVS